MKKIIIFTGLSVRFDDAKEILDSTEEIEVIYKNPVKRGDVWAAISENPDIIGIIDGVFHQSPSVGHKEILEAIKRDIKVIGASSMGALRASELDVLGMIGIGYVYRQYAEGIITSDDDVAVVFDSESLEAYSEPLVNMDYVFKKAVKSGIITEDDRLNLYKIAKSIFYPKRNYSSVLAESSLNKDKKEELDQFISKSVNIKEEDGKELLRYIKKMIE